MEQTSKEYFNAMLESCYYSQIIDEACNGDMVFNNQFRKVLTVQDCVNADSAYRGYRDYAQRIDVRGV